MTLSRNTLLAVATVMALSACKRDPATAPGPTATPAAAPQHAPQRAAFDPQELQPTISACQDLNGFVNSKWLAKTTIPPDETEVGSYPTLQDESDAAQREIVEALGRSKPVEGSVEQLVGTFYASGMDEATIQRLGDAPIRPRLAQIEALKTPQDVANFIAARNTRGAGLVFKFGAYPDFQDASKVIAYAEENGMTLPSKAYYTDSRYADIRKAYLDYITQSFVLAGATPEAATVQAKQVLQVERALAAASLSPVEARDPKTQYHLVSVAQADAVTPHFSWKAYLAAQGLSTDQRFSLSQPRFFAGFDHLLKTLPVSQWQAYLRFRTIDDAAFALSKPFVDNRFAFRYKTMDGQQAQRPRWKRVLFATNEAIGEGLGQLYVAKMFTPEAKQRATELIENIRQALKLRIQQADWMTAETKSAALKKWAGFVVKVGYPDHWRSWSGLHFERDAYLRNVETAAAFNYRYELAKVGKPADLNAWFTTPQTVNAFYFSLDNSINFPAAVLRPPFFDVTADDALNYGAIGAVMGHEATHGFDDQGSKFNAVGTNVNWWAPADLASFTARASKLVTQFNAYTPLPNKPDVHVNGELTLGENIADLGGINVAFDALQANLQRHPERGADIDGFTPQQRFFLGWARLWRGTMREEKQLSLLNSDGHAPYAVRTNASPSNMPQFATAFGCKPGDAMVRSEQDRVVIW